MSACGRTAQLEAVVAGEAPAALANELRAHAVGCPRCRHELRWLESERALFRERAARDEVGQLWAGVAERRGLAAPRPWSRVLLGVAASVALLLVAGRVAVGRSGAGDAAGFAEPVGMSEALMSPALPPLAWDNCSRLPDGVGFHCGPAIPASFVASR